MAFDNPPAKPHSLKEIVGVLLTAPGYKEFIFDLLKKVRSSDDTTAENAAVVLEAHFRPTRKELREHKIPAEQLDKVISCTEHRSRLLDFSEHLPHVPEKVEPKPPPDCE